MSNAVSSGTTNRPTVVHFVFPVAILTWLEIESAGWVVEHFGCVLVSSSLKRCIRPLWNSLLYNYLALYSGGSSGGAWGARPPSFRLKWGPKARKKFFWDRPPLSQGLDDCAPPYLRVWMTAPPLISESGWLRPPLSQGLDDCAPPLPYLKVWICHCCKLSRINCHQD